MEKVALILRKSEVENKFREVILRAFNKDEFEYIQICSGFFQERGKYFASSCFVNNAPRISCKRRVSVVGVYNGIWIGDFYSFVTGLKSISCKCGCKTPLNVSSRKVKRYHWHAKVFIAFDSENNPQLAVIGSSNITNNAFGINKTWNFEADVILWNEANNAAKNIMESVFETINNDDASGIIVSNYAANDKANRGLSIQDRMRKLSEEITAASELIE